MFSKLDDIVKRFHEVEQELCRPDITDDMKKYRELTQARAELVEIVEKYQQYKQLKKTVEEARAILEDSSADKDLKDMAQAEFTEYKDRLAPLEDELKLLLVPKDPNDQKNAILEIRQGTGGEEAALFAGELYEMYRRYCEAQGWVLTVMSVSEAEQGGLKEVVAEVSGQGVYGRLKYESGVHRVQRVPKTEAQGRVHTSAATVAIIPEVEDVDIEINPADLKVDTFRSSGAGGQHINKTESAIRITHIPTGTVVSCQEGRSQHSNRDKAMQMLKSRIFDQMENERLKKEKDLRKMQVGSGDRSEKIRTYNFPQNRMTDHRIGLTLYQLDAIMQGDLKETIEALITADRIAKLKG